MTQGRNHKTPAQIAFDNANKPLKAPSPTGEKPNPPSWLKGEALREWNRIADPLYEAGLIDAVDRSLLTAYCSSWATYVDATRDLLENGYTIESVGDTVKANPAITAADKALKAMLAISGQIGLSVNARNRVGASMPSPQGGKETEASSKLEGFLSGSPLKVAAS